MENNIIASFSLELPKTAKTLAKFVCKDDLRPMLNMECGKGRTDTRTDKNVERQKQVFCRSE